MAYPELPTPEEIKALPSRAIVAFAARCARRVQPLFLKGPLEPSFRVARVFEKAIIFAERFAQFGSFFEVVGGFAQTLEETFGDLDSNRAHADLPKYALNAPAAAMLAFQSFSTGAASIDAAALTAVRAADSCSPSEVEMRHKIVQAIRSDFNLLLIKSKRQNWTNDSGVPSYFFGTMWPDGEPAGWPVPATKHFEVDIFAGSARAVGLTVTAPPDADTDDVIEYAQRLVAAMDRLYRAIGSTQGLRLTERTDAHAMDLVPCGDES